MEATEVGWGRVNPPADKSAKMRDMLKLHEFYFDKTDRFISEKTGTDFDLASIEGSNLIREILDQLKRKIGLPTNGNCPRATAQSDFVGLIGHDTNLATVGALLGLNWRFDDAALPADTRGLPANDALPAGALVFELRERTDKTYFVRVEYVAQSLSQMRYGPADKPFRLAVDGAACVQTRPCEMPLEKFEQLVNHRMRRQFLSTCTGQKPPQQTCLALPTRTTNKAKPRRG
jgi:4-phytase/acid phosphatase